MPRRGHSSGRRACTGQSDSESSSESRSDLEGASLGTRHVPRIVRAPPVVRMAVNTQVACPGCGLAFASLYILKQHRNAHRLANPACRAAASAMKRPRIVLIEDLNAISETTVMLRYPDGLVRESYVMMSGSIQDQVELDQLCCEGPQLCKQCSCPKDRLHEA